MPIKKVSAKPTLLGFIGKPQATNYLQLLLVEIFKHTCFSLTTKKSVEVKKCRLGKCQKMMRLYYSSKIARKFLKMSNLKRIAYIDNMGYKP